MQILSFDDHKAVAAGNRISSYLTEDTLQSLDQCAVVVSSAFFGGAFAASLVQKANTHLFTACFLAGAYLGGKLGYYSFMNSEA